ncbi:MAG TPA: hypothetical protein VI893_00230 [Thermoplasmata archaeon]|nr:hypothetical protein [Thermoplasmata archaeon]
MKGPVRAAATLALVTLLASCGWAGDDKAVRVPFAQIKQQIAEAHSNLKRAVDEGSLDRLPALQRNFNAQLDAVSAQSSAMNLLDREHLLLNLATVRRCLTEIDRFAASGDVELVRAQVSQLDPTMEEIATLLDRADKIATAKE